MPKVSAKRQITLPIKQCRLAGIKPGDEYQSFVDSDGRITIVKKVKGAAKGLLKHIKADANLTDQQSMQSSLAE
ncbi:MAG: AbrB/MazE/SpoVT family DNA-binding domain-containing protein [Robiginitomaculum sp.]|nr:AbrB/MazE/SpoVT family DNA-binding domain-containing protein [Robiginitomaculum sp.]